MQGMHAIEFRFEFKSKLDFFLVVLNIFTKFFFDFSAEEGFFFFLSF